MTETSAAKAAFAPADVLAGHLAALLPALPQATLEAAAEGLTSLGYRRPESAETPEPEYISVLTEEAIVRGANQLRSQINDFTSPDILMRKRAKFVLNAAIRYLKVEIA